MIRYDTYTDIPYIPRGRTCILVAAHWPTRFGRLDTYIPGVGLCDGRRYDLLLFHGLRE